MCKEYVGKELKKIIDPAIGFTVGTACISIFTNDIAFGIAIGACIAGVILAVVYKD